MNTKTHSDIKTESFLLRILPESCKLFAILARLDRPIGIWLLLLPGCWAIMLAAGGPLKMELIHWQLMGLFALGAVVMRAAGCVINDLWDRTLDQNVERTRTRPLASGAISQAQALTFLAVLLFAGLLVLLRMNDVTIVLGVIVLPLIAFYPLMKRFTWWPQAFLGLTFNFGALMGWSAVTGEITAQALLLYAGGIFWTLGYDTVYALQDREDDALAGIKSTARLFGAQAKLAIACFYMLAWLCLDGALSRDDGALMFLCAAPAGLHMFWQVRSLLQDSPENALKIFRSNRDFGLLILLGIALGTSV